MCIRDRLLTVELIRHRKETQKDIRAGLYSIFKFQFDSSLGTGRKVKFAPYILCLLYTSAESGTETPAESQPEGTPVPEESSVSEAAGE